MEDLMMERNSTNDGGIEQDETVEGSAGTYDFIPLNPHLGLRRRTNTNMYYSEDDHHQETETEDDQHQETETEDDQDQETETEDDHHQETETEDDHHLQLISSIQSTFNPVKTFSFKSLKTISILGQILDGIDINPSMLFAVLDRSLQVTKIIYSCSQDMFANLSEYFEDSGERFSLPPVVALGVTAYNFLRNVILEQSLSGLGSSKVFEYLSGRCDIEIYSRERVDAFPETISPPDLVGTDYNLNSETGSIVSTRLIQNKMSSLLGSSYSIDLQEYNSYGDEEVHGRNGRNQKVDLEWIFVITNVGLESILAVCGQLTSKQKPQYALLGMLISYVALVTCIMEIIYEGRKRRPIWRRRRSNWYYYGARRGKSIGTLTNIVALVCALSQCVVSTINYRFLLSHTDVPIKLATSSIILAIGVLFSKIFKYRERSMDFDLVYHHDN